MDLVDPDKEYLTEEELLRLEGDYYKIATQELRVRLARAELKHMELEKTLKERDIGLKAYKVQEAIEKANGVKNKAAETKKKIAAEYGLEGDWGFNPESGEIMRQEPEGNS